MKEFITFTNDSAKHKQDTVEFKKQSDTIECLICIVILVIEAKE